MCKHGRWDHPSAQKLLNRTNVPHDVYKDVNAVDDFVQVALSGHTIAAVMECFGMESLGDKPNPDLVPSNLESLDKEETSFVQVGWQMVLNYTNIALPSEKCSTKTCPAADMVMVHQHPRLAWP